MSGKSAVIELNDILDELKDENNRLNKKLLFANKCINILNKFKTYLNVIYNKFETHLDSNEIQLLTELEIEYKNHMINEELNDKQTEQLVIHNRHKTNEEKNIIKTNIKHKSQSIVKSIKVLNNKKQKDLEKVKTNERVRNYKYDRHRCDWIGCSFRSESLVDLKAHQNYHTGDRPFKCTHLGCDKAFVGNRQLKTHIKVVHTLEKTIPCQISGCDMKFKNKTLLTAHLKVHNMEKRYVCEYCDYKSRTKYQLECHIERLHTTVYRTFICSFEGCDKSYRFKHDLDKHSKIHKNLETKCGFPNCDREFKNCLGLKRHQKFDHSDNELTCEWPGCEYITKKPDLYRKHFKTHTTDANCVCRECGKIFKNVKRLNQHFINHSNEFQFCCVWPECDYRCKRAYVLNLHLRKHQRNNF